MDLNIKLLDNFITAAKNMNLSVDYYDLHRAYIIFPEHVKYYAYCWLPTNKIDGIDTHVSMYQETQKKLSEISNDPSFINHLKHSEMAQLLRNIESNISRCHLEFGTYDRSQEINGIIDEYLMSVSAKANSVKDIQNLFKLMFDMNSMEKEILVYSLRRESL